MTSFGALVRLFIRDLVRRRMTWALALLALAGVALNYWTTHSIEEAVGNGATWDMATRRAASGLDELASMVRGWATFVVIVFAALVAPESRRNGTTQFVLSLGIRRDVLASAQFAAMAIVVGVGTLILHIGFSVAGLRTGAVTPTDVAAAWPGLLVPLLAAAAAAFALSLTASAIETYLVFLGVPLLTRTLPSLTHSFPRSFPKWLVRAADNLSLLFPETSELIAWPHTSFTRAGSSMQVALAWPTMHACLAIAFWVVLGVWLHGRHDFGSRTAVK